MKTIYKIIAPLLSAAVLTVSFSGCFITDAVNNFRADLYDNINFEDDADYTEVESESPVDCDFYSPAVISYGYDSLYTETQKKCYNDMKEAVYRISETVGERSTYPVGKIYIDDADFSEADMHMTINAFIQDHPEIFWISNQFSYGSMGNQTTLQLYSYLSGTQCTEYINEFTDEINKIITSVPSGLKPYHVEKYIHNTLLDRCDYAEGVHSSEDGWSAFTAYGAIVDGSAVCEGYSYAMNLLLSKVGISSFYLNGYAEDTLHMWNVVNIDGNWYHLDSTWNDSQGSYYNYFNLNDTQIEKDHTVASLYADEDGSESKDLENEVFNLFIPECSSESANYYVVESTLIIDYDESAEIMVHDLIQAANNLDTEFTVRIDSSLDFNEALDLLFNKEPYYMFDYIAKANEQLDDEHQINSKSVQIIIVENFNSVVIQMEYD